MAALTEETKKKQLRFAELLGLGATKDEAAQVVGVHAPR
jgi:hypothetical protein